MANTLRDTFSDIADAIRAKGVTGTMTPLEMPTKIGSISGGGDPRYEVSQQGGLVNKSFVVNWFNDLTSIPDNSLQYAYYGGNVTSASFPNVSSVGSYGLTNAFYNCSSLTSVDLSSLTSVGTQGCNNAFYNCSSLTSVDLSSMTSVGFSGLQNAFMGCTSLSSIDLSKVTSIGNTGCSQAFRGCSSLISVDLSKMTSVGTQGLQYAFLQCSSLKNVYLSSLSSPAAANSTKGTFSNCTHLELVDFSEATAVPAINTDTFTSTNNTFKIVVPDALYDQWIVATNWAALASHIVKASQYTP